MLVFGIMMTTLGSILPSMTGKFGLSASDSAGLFLFMTFGMFAGSVLFGPIVDRFGYKLLLILSTGAIAASLAGIAMATGIAMIRASLLLIGFGGGVINGATNAIVSEISEEGKSAGLSLLGVFFGIGAFGVPFALGQLIGKVSYESVIFAIAAIVLIPFFFFIATAFPKPKMSQGFPVREMVTLLKSKSLLLLGFVLFFESGIEIATGGWVSSFFSSEFGIDPGRAVLYMSFYWLGLTAARLALNLLLKRLSPRLLINICFITALAGTIILTVSSSLLPAVLGLMLIGAGFAAVFPVILAHVGELYPEITGTAFGIAMVMALCGGMFIPWLMGFMGELKGLRLSFSIVSISIICQIGIYLFWTRQQKKTITNH